jgi:hypothetical protein
LCLFRKGHRHIPQLPTCLLMLESRRLFYLSVLNLLRFGEACKLACKHSRHGSSFTWSHKRTEGGLSIYTTFLSSYSAFLSIYTTFLSSYTTFLSSYTTFLSSYTTFLSIHTILPTYTTFERLSVERVKRTPHERNGRCNKYNTRKAHCTIQSEGWGEGSPSIFHNNIRQGEVA